MRRVPPSSVAPDGLFSHIDPVAGQQQGGQQQQEQEGEQQLRTAMATAAAPAAAVPACVLRGGGDSGEEAEQPGLHQHLVSVEWNVVRAISPSQHDLHVLCV